MKTALVGGASKGLGYGCAYMLAAQGHTVVMCARSSAELEVAAKQIASATGSRTIPIPCDLSSREALAALQQQLADQSIDIDILVNNVGGPKAALVSELTEQDWEQGLDLLFRSTLRLYAMVLPHMRRNKWGRIINILSPVAIEPVPMLAISSVLRAGLAAYAKLLSRDVGRDGITVHSLMPGGFRTARTEALEKETAARENLPLETVQARTSARVPIGRMLSPDELGRVVVFLSSEEAGGVTGTLLPVDGGQMITV